MKGKIALAALLIAIVALIRQQTASDEFDRWIKEHGRTYEGSVGSLSSVGVHLSARDLLQKYEDCEATQSRTRERPNEFHHGNQQIC